MDYTEFRILKKAKAGDGESFEILLKKYEKYLYGSIRDYYLAYGDKDDLIQEGMIGLLRGIKSFDFDKNDSFKYFIIMCIRRQIITALKNSNTKKNQVLNNAYFDKNEICEDKIFIENNSNPEEEYLYKELILEFFEYSKRNFSELEKKVLEYLIRGYSYKEIAKKIGKSDKTIDNTYQRIKIKVKNWLKD